MLVLEQVFCRVVPLRGNIYGLKQQANEGYFCSNAEYSMEIKAVVT